jgi:hypothetical protein
MVYYMKDTKTAPSQSSPQRVGVTSGVRASLEIAASVMYVLTGLCIYVPNGRTSFCRTHIVIAVEESNAIYLDEAY